MSRIIINDVVTAEVKKAIEVSKYLWRKGWAERNGGNISINLTGLMPNSRLEYKRKYIEVKNYPKELAGKIFFVSGTGERLRELYTPELIACIIQFDKKVNGYHIIWGGEKPDFKPTSELISHVNLHLYLENEGKGYRTVLHTHPTEMICMSHHPIYSRNEVAFNNAIWSMMPEVRIFIPHGIALVPYAMPGSERLANLTRKALKNRDVVLWLKHGALAVGQDVYEAFDFIDVANKGCGIFMKCLASGFTPVGLTKDEMQELADAFNL